MGTAIIPEIRQIDYSGQKVLSTLQLAKLFKCKRNNITDNFRNHKAEFVEGVDYFHLMGDELNALKQKDKSAQNDLCAFSKYSTNAYLWTIYGVEKLSKIIGTDAAKLIFTSLQFGYFQQGEKSMQKETSAQINPPAEFSRLDRIKILRELLDYTDDKDLRNDIICEIAFLVTNKNY